ncbi:ATP-binding cassette sub-family A member 8-A [Caerostris darwini]|uniref:ATP-binding cassette sub-family A member 8-A n=1 Tax=Caerostris darwini TaxID=1538125 RepID=A0AAV4U8Y4_9ARAC|nr:ATP-binding cassette sub-family A member 8-A [Caerostris darwini]
MDWNVLTVQIKALIWRNYCLMKRNHYQLITLFFTPLMLTTFILLESNQNNVDKIPAFVQYSLPFTHEALNSSEKPEAINLCVSPRESEERLVNSIQKLLTSYLNVFVNVYLFEDNSTLKENLLQESYDNATKCNASIAFSSAPFDGYYELLVPEGGCSEKVCPFTNPGFLSNVQQAVDIAVLKAWLGDSSLKLPPTKITAFLDFGAAARNVFLRILKLTSLLIFLPLATIVTENVTYENNNKIKESMLLMGMKPVAYWLAFLVFEMVIILAVLLPLIVALYIMEFAIFKGIVLYFLLSFGFGCSIIIFAMTVTRFCSKSMIANMVIFLFTVTAIATDVLSEENPTDIKPQSYLLMLVSPMGYERGFHWILTEQDYDRALPCLLLVYFDLLLYALIDILLEYFCPYGITIPWHKLRSKKKTTSKSVDIQENEAFIHSRTCPSENDPSIKLEGITKSFSACLKPSVLVLNGVSLPIFKGEVTCLLGPNGAGKSTLMKIISKVLPPDEGSITTEASSKLGVCPQENIIHKELTTDEHLYLYGSLKGISASNLKEQTTRLLESFDLVSSRDSFSKVLSGGQKRKLCVAIAMIGDPEILLLDEPSSGMNPHSRRLLWNMLQDYTKAGRTVLFTTHYMDEAELLSDRIALLNYGTLKCWGTAMKIKKDFSGGYNIKISLNSEASMYCKTDFATLLENLSVKPKITFESDTEIVVKLPSFDVGHCAELFKKIEEHYKDIESSCFNISVSSLEDIFYMIAGANSEHAKEKEIEYVPFSQNETQIPENKFLNCCRSFSTLLRYRARLILRSRYTIFIVAAPLLIVSWTKFLSESTPTIVTEIGPDLYRNEIIHLVNETGKPLIFLGRSMSNSDVNFEVKNPTEKFQKEAFITVHIQKFEFVTHKAEIEWSFDINLNRQHAFPILQNFISKLLVENSQQGP